MNASELVHKASRNAFYDLIAVALTCGDTRTARQRVAEAREYLPQTEVNGLVAELEADYHEFTYA